MHTDRQQQTAAAAVVVAKKRCAQSCKQLHESVHKILLVEETELSIEVLLFSLYCAPEWSVGRG
eukprot:17155-Heterococcus_DN1.PRE.2